MLESFAAKGITKSQKILPEKQMPIAYGSFSKYQNAVVQNDEQEDKKQKKKKVPGKRKSVKR